MTHFNCPPPCHSICGKNENSIQQVVERGEGGKREQLDGKSQIRTE
jgi:hypothetical protein